MALFRPGKRSNKSMFLSGLWVIILLLTLVPGHLVLVSYIWFHYDDGSNLLHVVELTGLSTRILWLSVVVSFFMDLWVILHDRQGHRKRR